MISKSQREKCKPNVFIVKQHKKFILDKDIYCRVEFDNEDIENNNSKSLTFFYFIFGALIFLILFTLNSTEVSEIIFDITSFYIPQNFFKISLIALIVLNSVFLIVNYKKI